MQLAARGVPDYHLLLIFALGTFLMRSAGCIVNEGQVKRGARVRLIRDEVVLHEGELSQLKRFKGDVKDVKEGTECGMAFANYQNIEVGDMIECFEVEEFAREL